MGLFCYSQHSILSTSVKLTHFVFPFQVDTGSILTTAVMEWSCSFCDFCIRLSTVDVWRTTIFIVPEKFENGGFTLKTHQMFSVHTTTLEEFENGVFTLKTHQMFSVHTRPEKFENATITFVFEEIWKRHFHSENTSNVFRKHYAWEIWKRRFHS